MLLLLSCLARDLQGMHVSCTYHNFHRYDCRMENAVHTLENAEFEMYAKYNFLNVEEQVFRLEAINSVLHYVPMQILVMLKNLQDLVLMGVQIKELRPFTNCESLGIINLNDNEIKSIGRVFTACTKLTAIYLNNNQIKSIERDAFRATKLLVHLLMSPNQIEDFPEGLLVENSNLLNLDLRGSKFKLLPPKSFQSLTSLRNLYVGNTPFNSPHDISNHFKGLTSLELLDLMNCNIYKISKGTFDDLVSLLHLELSWNHIHM